MEKIGKTRNMKREKEVEKKEEKKNGNGKEVEGQALWCAWLIMMVPTLLIQGP